MGSYKIDSTLVDGFFFWGGGGRPEGGKNAYRPGYLADILIRKHFTLETFLFMFAKIGPANLSCKGHSTATYSKPAKQCYNYRTTRPPVLTILSERRTFVPLPMEMKH